MSEEHRIETLDALIAVSRTTDDIDGLIADLGWWLRLAAAYEPPDGVKFKPLFIWKDDGIQGMSGVTIEITETRGASQ